MTITKGKIERLSWGKSGKDYSALSVKGFMGVLFMALESPIGADWADKIAATFSSNQESEIYRWLGSFPVMREWIGNRQSKGMPIYEHEIRNKLYECTVDFDKNDFRAEKSEQIRMRLGEAGQVPRQHRQELLSTLIEANGVAYDGQNFFDTDHTLGGDSGTHKNLLGIADYGQFNVEDASNPTPEEMAKAIVAAIQHFFTFLDNAGRPMNGSARRFQVMVPPNMWGAAIQAVRGMLAAGGGTALLPTQDFTVEVVVNGYLTSATKFYVFRDDHPYKPFIIQEVFGPEVEFRGEGSDDAFYKHRYVFGIEITRGCGYGQWTHAVAVQLG